MRRFIFNDIDGTVDEIDCTEELRSREAREQADAELFEAMLEHELIEELRGQ